ncbi:riboflavin kinase / FMN adenylyltransferase [Alkalithermobacter thermoalcaliphilus JW-YL-7 = DSM 7308]|uniref:Riboflavin biosynthesis protein n=1 Tax=Alkalithermobacter thermoalcaliphilus JW-YL-7 = DSM 7308 TaxID=1121328 RepID=A0A150FQC1_CLOPD|nr:riboflavin biosynthesis protein RibF [[Clostridium] paradoxum JW-YL-7 = DSM 7308]SHK59424.1 riboflavin kinase / FMN adenylyltransferase [[Clostridium] paradoxum JW-YL-7 = DSM 7308]
MHLIKKLEDVYIKYPTVVTVGSFDGIHIGHQYIIKKVSKLAKQKNFKSVVFTFSNHPLSFVRKTKVPKISSEEERCKFIETLDIDYCISIPFNDTIANLSAESYVSYILADLLKCKHIIVGHDFTFGKNKSANAHKLQEIARRYNIDTQIVDPILLNGIRVSSSFIRNLIHEGKVKECKEFLGRFYSLRGTVNYGMQLGRKLGFPTANIAVRDDIVLPKTGVYYTKVEVEGKIYDGATNVGFNPTVCGKSLNIETHIFDFNKEIYKSEITIYFLERIRDEKRFNHIDELVEQVKKDITKIKKYLHKNEYMIR